MRRLVIHVALLSALVLAGACGDRNGDVTVGAIITDSISVDAPAGGGPYELELAMGAGTLELAPGAGKVVQGTITYNSDLFKPNVTTSGNTVRIEQGRGDFRSIPSNVKNDWNLEIGNVPLALKLSVGAARGKAELGGLALTGLNLSQGASDFSVSFDRPNTTEMGTFRFTAGAARSVITGLANANAATLEFKGGAGDLSLGFDGELRRDMQVNVIAAAGNLVITVPAGVRAVATVRSTVGKVVAGGAWARSGNDYVLSGSGGPQISFTINVSVGRLELRGA